LCLIDLARPTEFKPRQSTVTKFGGVHQKSSAYLTFIGTKKIDDDLGPGWSANIVKRQRKSHVRHKPKKLVGASEKS
jgi:hypothetical protein